MDENSITALGRCRILDLTDDRGDFCTKLLADLGADVIKIEPPGGEPTRRLPPFKNDIPHLERSLHFLYFSANKRSITLNLECDDGRAIFKRLVATADVLVESFVSGRMVEWGLGYEMLKSVNQGIVFTSITDFGQTGPYTNFRGNELVDFAMGGTLNRCGDPKLPPCLAPGTLACDTACLYAACGTIFALSHRWLTGQGQHVDISVQEAVAATDDYSIARFSHDHVVGQRNGPVVAGNLPSGIYACKDGHVRLKVLTPEAWRAFYEWMGSPEALSDPIWDDANFRGKHPDFVEPFITDFISKYTKALLEAEGQRRRITITPVNAPSEFVSDLHERARGYFIEVEHPLAGQALYPGSPYSLSETPWRLERPAPLLGEHNIEIYCNEIGLSHQELAALRAAGII